MAMILDATFSNGQLILQDELNPALEGKKLKVIILETSEPNNDHTDAKTKRQRFLEAASKHAFELPADYKFDRNEIYDR